MFIITIITIIVIIKTCIIIATTTTVEIIYQLLVYVRGTSFTRKKTEVIIFDNTTKFQLPVCSTPQKFGWQNI